uniref:Uncharacterized protein n=1 Tax=Bionectria ochroleuca TaxID=29856 RepID=A0A0B7KLS3_BIOOC
MEPLFTIPIAALPPNHPGGEIVCTVPRPRTYVLTFSSPPDNRMTTPFCRALLSALDVLEFGDHESGVVITTSAIPKFYSNGLDLEHAVATDGFWALLYEGVESALKFIDARGIEDKGKTGVYGVIKAEMYKDLVRMLKSPGLEAEDARFDAAQENERERKEFGKVWYEQWQRENQKAKL